MKRSESLALCCLCFQIDAPAIFGTRCALTDAWCTAASDDLLVSHAARHRMPRAHTNVCTQVQPAPFL